MNEDTWLLQTAFQGVIRRRMILYIDFKIGILK